MIQPYQTEDNLMPDVWCKINLSINDNKDGSWMDMDKLEELECEVFCENIRGSFERVPAQFD